MTEGDLDVGQGVVIPESELLELASRAGGPGGQHVNKSATRVTLRWSPVRSRALGAQQRQLLLFHLRSRLTRDGELIVHADRERSRRRNLIAARRRLAELVADALRIRRARLPTSPSHAERRRRQEAKRQRGELKRRRRPVRREDDQT